VIEGVILTLIDPLTFVEFASVTEAVKAKLPLCSVVPEMSPLLWFSDKPSGKAPLVIWYVYGAAPPEAARVELYGAPTDPSGSLAVCIESFTGGATLTSAEAETELSAALVAVTVILVAEDTCGAVKKPLAEMAPALDRQATVVLLVDVKVAENCCVAPGIRLSAAGVSAIWIVEGLLGGRTEEDDVPDGSPAHATAMPAAMTRISAVAIF